MDRFEDMYGAAPSAPREQRTPTGEEPKSAVSGPADWSVLQQAGEIRDRIVDAILSEAQGYDEMEPPWTPSEEKWWTDLANRAAQTVYNGFDIADDPAAIRASEREAVLKAMHGARLAIEALAEGYASEFDADEDLDLQGALNIVGCWRDDLYALGEELVERATEDEALR